MRIVGIDPGMRLTGYGCVELRARSMEPTLVEGGVLRFDVKGTIEERLGRMFDGVTELLTELKPDHVAVEKLFAHYKHPRTAVIMAHARGVILLAAQRLNLTIEHLPSTEVKKSITGNGHATKAQIQLAIASQCGLAEPPNPPDVADAIAIAMTSARRRAYVRST